MVVSNKEYVRQPSKVNQNFYRNVNAVEQFIPARLTVVGRTDAEGILQISDHPIGSFISQSESNSRLSAPNQDSIIATTAPVPGEETVPLYVGDVENSGLIKLYLDEARDVPAADISVAVSYWYFAPLSATMGEDSTAMLNINANAIILNDPDNPVPVFIENDDTSPVPVTGPATISEIREAFNLIDPEDIINVNATIQNDSSEPVPVTGPATISEIREAFNLDGSYAYRMMLLIDNPADGQMLSFGDGSVGVSGMYVNDPEDHPGAMVDFFIIIGIDPEETQANTVVAFDLFEGPKPNVSVSSMDNYLVILHNVMGSEAFIGLGPPATVGIDEGLVLGQDQIDFRNLTVRVKDSIVDRAIEISPDNDNNLTNPTTAIYVGIEGDLKVDLVSGGTITFKNLANGVFHPIHATKVYLTGTSAQEIVGVY